MDLLINKKKEFEKYFNREMKNIKNIKDIDLKKSTGIKLNQEKQEFFKYFNIEKLKIESKKIKERLEKSKIDVTMPGKQSKLGSINLITKSMQEISNIFANIGFQVYDGPSVETDWYNFEALNIDKQHPARSMHDTFFINDKYLLRTHTSNMQIRIMEQEKAPFRFISMGRVYRRDQDATHTPMFHQIEGVVVDKNANLKELKSLLHHVIEKFFGKPMEILFRNSYFPFTSPSFEVDIKIDGKWLEVLGSGIIHPNVYKNCKLNSDLQGYAFGMGIERLTMIKYGINDLRLLFNSDMRHLSMVNTY